MASKRKTRRAALRQAALAAGTMAAGSALPAAAFAVGTAPALKKVRVAVVGGGFGASFHWHEDPGCTVVGVSDLRPERREILRKRYRCDRVYDSLETMLKEAKDVDAVAIFTEATNHEKHVRWCLQRGWHVISAVPTCVSLEEAERLKETKEKTGLAYMMAETSYYRHHTIAARELHEQGHFGELFYSEVEYYHPKVCGASSSLSFYQGQRTWRYGYPPMLYPTHSTGFLVGVTRERLTEVSCLGWGNPAEASLKDNAYRNPMNVAAGMFKTDRGHICRCNVFWDGTADGERAQWFGTKLTMYMPGSGGQPFRLEGAGAPKLDRLPDYWQRLPEPMRHDTGHGGSHPFLTHEFVSALAEGREPAIDLYESLAMTVPGIVAHQSALAGGAQLKVPSFDRKRG